MQNLILGGVLGGNSKIQGCFVPQKSIFDLFGKKLPARMVTVKYTTLEMSQYDSITNFHDIAMSL